MVVIRSLLDKGAACGVRAVEIPGKDARQFLVLVERHVDQEDAAHTVGDLHHLFPDGVALCNAPGSIGVGDHACIVVAQHRALARHSGHECLPAPRESRKEVGFDKAGQHLDIAGRDLAVEPDVVPARGDAHVLLRLRVEGIVLNNAVPPEQLIRHAGRSAHGKHAAQFLFAVGPMGAQRATEDDLFARHMGQLPEHRRQDQPMRRCARDVAEHDADPIS